MNYIYGTANIEKIEESVVVLGNFDGVHKGHQSLIRIAQEEAKIKSLKTVVFSFYPHPSWIIGDHPKALIMSRRDKKQMFESLGIDLLIEYPFTRSFAAVSPEAFFVDVLLKQLKAKVLIVGMNYYFGKNKAGTPQVLKEFGRKYGVTVHIVDAIKENGKIISSSSIRALLEEGKIEEANEMLGHPYMIVGNVVQGKKIGRTIGFPTINLIADPDRIYPPNGVYATRVVVYNQEYMGMTNIGYNPTVEGKHKMIETHIFDFNEDIYGAAVELYFYHAIRKEEKFSGVEALAAQITKDKVSVKSFFKDEIKLFAK